MKEVKGNSETGATLKVLHEKVEIEDCSDDSDPNVATVATQVKNTKPAEETETKAEVIVEEVKLDVSDEGDDEDEEEEESNSDVVETVEKVKKPVESSNEQSSTDLLINQNDSAAGIIVTTTPPTPTTTTPALSCEHKPVAHVVAAEQSKEVVLEQVEEKEVEVEEAPVSFEAKKEQELAGNESAETKVPAIDSVASTPKWDSTDTQALPNQQQAENWNNTIKDIISDIDSNIEQENIILLQKKQKELLEQQQELAQQIRQQQLIAQQLAAENRIHQQQLEQQKQQEQKQQQQQQPHIQNQQPQIQQKTQSYRVPFNYQPTLTPYQPQENISKYSTVEESKNEHGFIRKTETYESKESSNATKHIDLHKIFKPATDAEEILPRNRKLYASSAFYTPGLHPTVEDQVELARRISHSLSDISNQKSKGQSMYVNRKKRSVKWVHEGAGKDSSIQEKPYQEEFKENTVSETTFSTSQNSSVNQVPLRLLMNPRGKVRDITSGGDSFTIETGLLSPDKCAELITALQTQKGKGAELFAKRRRKSEKWIVDETNTGTQSPSGLPDYHQQQVKPPTSPSVLPAYSDAGKHRVQLNLHQEQMLEKYAKPSLKVVKTPWEAALETGSASSAFVEDAKLTPHHTPTPTVSPAPVPQYEYAGCSTVPDSVAYNDGYPADYNITPSHQLQRTRFPTSKAHFNSNPQRDLAYKPNLAQGWKSPSVSLPKENENEWLIKSLLKNCEYKGNKEEDQEVGAYNNLAEGSLPCEGLFLKQALDSDKVTKPHEFLDFVIRSPELRVSPIPAKSLLRYNYAIAELKVTGVGQQQTCNLGEAIKTDTIPSKPEERIKVREQLERLESFQNQLLEEQNQEKKRNQKERRMQQQQKLKQEHAKQQEPHPEQCVSTIKNIQIQEQQQQHNKEEEEYVKVAVRELISNYEQQLVKEEQCANRPVVTKPNKSVEGVKTKVQSKEPIDETDKSELSLSSTTEIKHTQQSNAMEDFSEQQILNTEELYLPKEISLESYALPPVVNIKEPECYKPSWKPTSTSLPVQTSFPVGKPNRGGFLSYGSASQPKQQHYELTSYRTVQQDTNPNVPQMNYSPSPLSYDKIAKFENAAEHQAQTNDWSNQSRRLNVQSHGAKVQNVSSAPFGERPVSGERASTASPYPYNAPKNNIYDRSTTPVYAKRNNVNELLHGQNYNNTARGWQSSGRGPSSHPAACSEAYNSGLGAGSYGCYQPKPLAAANNLPYTDF